MKNKQNLILALLFLLGVSFGEDKYEVILSSFADTFKTVKYWQDSLKANPGDFNSLKCLLKFHFIHKQYPQSFYYAEKISALYQNDPEALSVLAFRDVELRPNNSLKLMEESLIISKSNSVFLSFVLFDLALKRSNYVLAEYLQSNCLASLTNLVIGFMDEKMVSNILIFRSLSLSRALGSSNSVLTLLDDINTLDPSSNFSFFSKSLRSSYGGQSNFGQKQYSQLKRDSVNFLNIRGGLIYREIFKDPQKTINLCLLANGTRYQNETFPISSVHRALISLVSNGNFVPVEGKNQPVLELVGIWKYFETDQSTHKKLKSAFGDFIFDNMVILSAKNEGTALTLGFIYSEGTFFPSICLIENHLF